MTDTRVEQWLPVPGFEGYYEVSDLGRARSLDRLVVATHRTQGSVSRRFRGRILARVLSEGYPIFHFRKNGRSEQVRAHRLVLETFIGPCPPGMQALHRRNDRADCRLANLYWGTPAQNSQDAIAEGTNQHTRKTHCGRGHRLGAPNARPSHTARGWRACLACHRSRDAWRYFPHKTYVDQEEWVQRKSDEYYVGIVTGQQRAS